MVDVCLPFKETSKLFSINQFAFSRVLYGWDHPVNAIFLVCIFLLRWPFTQLSASCRLWDAVVQVSSSPKVSEAGMWREYKSVRAKGGKLRTGTSSPVQRLQSLEFQCSRVGEKECSRSRRVGREEKSRWKQEEQRRER